MLSTLAYILKKLVMPPVCLFLLGAVGLACLRFRPRLGKWLLGIAAATLLVLCTPFVSTALLRSLQAEPLDLESVGPDVGAIIVLGADFVPWTPDYDHSTVGPLSLERLRYAARLHRQTQIPILVSGGVLETGGPPLSSSMKDALVNDFGVDVRWMERRSRTTRENAQMSAELLLAEGIERALLVTHSWHMPRAQASFETTGLEVIPAPTNFRFWPEWDHDAVLPSSRALLDSSYAIHEWVGRLWYALLDVAEGGRD